MSLPDMALTKAEKKALRKERKRFALQREAVRGRVKMVVGYVLGLGLVVGLGWLAWQHYIPISNEEKNKPVGEIQEGEWTLGNREAAVVLMEYSDFQCPSCKAYQLAVKEVVETYPEQMVLGFRHLPLKTIHIQAALAAQAAEAAGKQGKFWEMHDQLYEHQSEWAENRRAKGLFIGYAEGLGLDVDQFKQDLTSKEIKAKVEADYRSGLSQRLNSTPSFFLNGERIMNPEGTEAFKQLMAEVIWEATAGAKTND